MADAMNGVIEANRVRQKRHQDRAARIRAAVAHAMEEAGKRSIKTADLTITERMGKPKVRIFDEAQLPTWATTTETVVVTKPNKAAIQEAYDADSVGFDCPGAGVTNAMPVLTVRTK